MTEASETAAAALARRSLYTVDEWQHALNALGDRRAESLLPLVEQIAPARGLTPLAAVNELLEGLPDA